MRSPHCIEAFVSTWQATPALDALTLRGIELIDKNLHTGINDPENRDARHALAEAAMIGGLAISSNSVGGCHAMAHQLSSVAGLHHGLACALMLPHQMAFSIAGALQRYAQIGKIFGAGLDADVETQADHAVESVRQLLAGSGLPTNLTDACVAEVLLPDLVERAVRDGNWITNPVPANEAEIEDLLRAAL